VAWQPIVFSTTAMSFAETLCHYRAADIAWITPLRDGLNLVAKEYIAANVEESGVLVLSEFAGAAVELTDAVLVNPYSLSQMDAAIDQALDMPEPEQRARMALLGEVVRRHDIGAWSEHIMDCFAELGPQASSAAEPNRSLLLSHTKGGVPMPDWLQQNWRDYSLWGWLAPVLCILLVVGATKLLRPRLIRYLQRLAERTATSVDEALVYGLEATQPWLVGAMVLRPATAHLPLGAPGRA